MSELFIQILTMMYAFVGVVVVVGYWPTLKDLYVHKKMSVNVHSYLIWMFTSGVGFLYATFVLSDVLLRVVMGLSFLSCTSIFLLGTHLKHKNKHL